MRPPGSPTSASSCCGEHAGFTGLRLLHVAVVAGVLALVFSLARRASGSRAVACAHRDRLRRARGLPAGAAASRAVLDRWRRSRCIGCSARATRSPSARRIAAAALLFAVWANCHAAFPLGLALLAASALAGLAASALAPMPARAAMRARAARLAAAFGAGLLASLANPSGVNAHLAWLRAGVETPSLTRVADEWARFEPWRLPVANLPPTPLAWVLVWMLLVLAPFVVWMAVRRERASRAATAGDTAPPQVAWMLVSLAALLTAVRFLWLGLFPLLALARAGRGRVRPAAAALAAALLVPAFFRFGDWPMVSAAMPALAHGYARALQRREVLRPRDLVPGGRGAAKAASSPTIRSAASPASSARPRCAHS